MKVLPIILDVGTNNEHLLADPLYVGLRRHRVSGGEYYDIVDEVSSNGLPRPIACSLHVVVLVT